MINAIKKAAIIGGGVIGGGWAARFQEPSLPLRTMEPHGLLEHLEHQSISVESPTKNNLHVLLCHFPPEIQQENPKSVETLIERPFR